MSFHVTNVLIIEDNGMGRDRLQRRLEQRGYRVSCALGGREVIEMGSFGPPDIIPIDVALRDMVEWETTRVLRANDGTRTVQVIPLTAHTMKSDRQNSVGVGCAVLRLSTALRRD